MQILRPYQIRALDGLRQELRAGKRRIVLVAPTGAGKTTIASALILSAVAKQSSVLFVAHRRELIDQAHARLAEHGVDAGIIMAGRTPADRLVQVGSIGTLMRRNLPPARIVIVDECHHARANSYGRVVDHYPEAALIGLTATPWRADGRGLGELFDATVVAATPSGLIAQGHLCDYDGYRYAAPDLSSVRTVAGDYEESGLALACSDSRVVGDIVDRYMAHCQGMRGVVFASSIENSKQLVSLFQAQGIAAEHLDYTMETARAGIVGRVRSGETTLISNVGILTEGVDIPELRACILARPTKSLALYLQMVGRVMRPKGGLKARIHDHGENVVRHGLPDAERDYSLTADTRRAALTPLRQCPTCFAYFEGTCPNGCAVVAESSSISGPENVAGTEEDIRAAVRTPRGAIDAFKAELLATAIARGYKGGWAVRRFLERYPQQPKPWGLYRQIEGSR